MVHKWIYTHLRKNIANKVRSEVDNVMTLVETRVQDADAVLTAIKNLMIPRVELAMKLLNASSGRGVNSVVLDPDRRDFQEISKVFK